MLDFQVFKAFFYKNYHFLLMVYIKNIHEIYLSLGNKKRNNKCNFKFV